MEVIAAQRTYEATKPEHLQLQLQRSSDIVTIRVDTIMVVTDDGHDHGRD